MIDKKIPLAIIGIGARFPGDINGPDGLWKALKEGRDCITEIPEDRWSIEKYYDPNPNKSGKIRAKKGGFIKGMKEFDAEFFDIYPKVASALDPRQRHLLEVSYESFEDAGLTLEQLDGSNTSVIMGVFLGDESKKVAGSDLSVMSPHTAMGSADTAVSARIAFQFNLQGPTLSVDTACSSSLTAVQIACNTLWMGDADMAIAGGVNLMTGHENTLQLSQGSFLSPDGYCKSFDASANGYTRGEGAGVIIIKPLDKAQKDGDNIYAVIRNSVVNSDGHTKDGLTVPNEFSQINMLEKAYGDVGISPKDVDYMEAHGTGTSVGDPKETFAFGQVFSKDRKSETPLIIGSIKTNFGHTEAVAGIAGLIKLALSIKNQQIPANLHFKTPNPAIKFDEWKLKVPTKTIDWPKTNGKKAIGGVNSFGAGGSNAHAVLEEYTPQKSTKKPKAKDKLNNFPQIFCISANCEQSLKDLAKEYLGFIKKTKEDLDDICYSAMTKRSLLKQRIAIIFESKKDLLSALKAYIDGKSFKGLVLSSNVSRNTKPKIAFVCSGQGPQWYAMGRQLMTDSKIFSDTINEIDKIFHEFSGYSLLKEMKKSSKDSKIGQTRIAQPAIMAVQIGLIHMWKSFGIEPQGLVGHSIGEVAAAYGSGAITLKQAVWIIYNRSKEQDRASGAGKMLAVGLKLEDARKRIKGLEARVSIAAVNGPEMTVLSGDEDPLNEIIKGLEKDEIFHQMLRVNVPFHSHHMDPIKDDMLKGLEGLKTKKSKVDLYSTVTGKQEDGTHLTSKYWYDNVRQTVYFTSAIEAMINDDYDYFIEIAPHPILGGGINDLLAKNNKKGEVISCLSRKIKDFEANIQYEARDFLNATIKAYFSNNKIDFSSLFKGDEKFVKLPNYQWQHKEYWLESEEREEARLGKPNHPFIKSCTRSISNENLAIFDLNLNKESEIFLKDHQIGGTVVFPGAAQIETAYEAGKEIYGDKFSHLENIKFPLALFLPEDETIPHARLEIVSKNGQYEIFSKQKKNDGWNRNGSGKICLGKASKFKSSTSSLETLKEKLAKKDNEVSVDEFYTQLKSSGIEFGPHFRLAKEMWQDGDEILAKIEIHEDDEFGMERYHMIPTLSDACLHIALKRPEDGLYLPHKYDKYKIYANANNVKTLWSYAKINQYDEKTMSADIVSYNQDSQTILEVQGINLKYLENSRKLPDDPYHGVYEHQWVKIESEKLEPKKEKILAFANCDFSKDFAKTLDENKYEVILVQSGSDYEFSLKKNRIFVDFSSKESLKKLFEDLLINKIKPSKIVNLLPLGVEFDENDKIDFSDQSKSIIKPILNLFQEIINFDYNLEIFLVTSGANHVNKKDKKINPLLGTVYGMTRVFANEYPNHDLRVIDISSDKTKNDAKGLLQEIIGYKEESKVSEVALRSYGRFAHKLVSVKNNNRKKKLKFSDQGTYLITGGATGFGLALTKWMFDNGARNFALVSRSGPKYDSDWVNIDEMKAGGANILIEEVKGDISKITDVKKIVKLINESNNKLKGIVHCAGILDDSTYPNMDMEKFMRVYNPKAGGAWNLHQATKDIKLDLFLMTSSASSILGIAGQNNYSAANSFLNHLAIYRKSQGLTAHSACMGLLSSKYAGMARGGDVKVFNMIKKTVGTEEISLLDMKNKIEILFSSKSGYLMLSPMNWRDFINSYIGSENRYMFKELVSNELSLQSGGNNSNKAKDVLLSATSDDQPTVTLGILKESLSKILGVEENSIAIDQAISNIGLDSLMLNQFRNWIQANFEINLSLMSLAKGPTLQELSINIIKEVLNSDKVEDLDEQTMDTTGISDNEDIEIISDKWMMKRRLSDQHDVKIFCLHPVGAGASIFSHFMFNPPKNAEIIPIQMPGRENRLEEGLYEDMDKLIPNLAKIIESQIDGKVVFWGHSWGGVTLYEIAKYLRRNNSPKYKNIIQLIVTGSIAPQLTVPWKDRDSIKETANENSSIKKLMSTISYIDDKDFLMGILPVMRKDMKLIIDYKYKQEEKLDIPIMAFGALEDEVVLISEIKQWQEQTNSKLKVHSLHGDHWFLSRNKEFITKAIEESIFEILGKNNK